jgi:hypothetical protein
MRTQSTECERTISPNRELDVRDDIPAKTAAPSILASVLGIAVPHHDQRLIQGDLCLRQPKVDLHSFHRLLQQHDRKITFE